MRHRYLLLFSLLILLMPTLASAQLEGLDKIITFNTRDSEIRDICMAIARLANVNLVVDPKIRGKMPFSINSVSAGDALELIAGITGNKITVFRNVVVVAQEETVKFIHGPGRSALFQLKYAKAEDVATLLNKVFAKDLSTTAHNQTNQILVVPK